MDETRFGYGKTLPGVSLADARPRVVAALATEGFGILTEIDMAAAFKAKLDVDFRPYVILGACNPTLAHRALQADGQIGLLLPCNVVIQQSGDGVAVSIANPRAMFALVEDAALDELVGDADARLRRALDAM